MSFYCCVLPEGGLRTEPCGASDDHVYSTYFSLSAILQEDNVFRFCQVMKDLTKAPTSRTLTHFILPVASGFLCSEKYAHKNNVVDAAVEVS
jgi:hypothetical protein